MAGRSRALACALAFLLGAVGSLLLSAGGTVVTPDSGQYLAAATNIVAGRGVTSPIVAETSRATVSQQLAAEGRNAFTEWPPGYPVAVAAVSALGPSPRSAARWVNALSVGALAAIVVLAVDLLAGSVLAGLAVATAVLCGPVVVSPVQLLSVGVLGQSAFVLSEAVFTAVVLGALVVAGRGLSVGSPPRWWLAAGSSLVALATLVRFVGVAAGAALAVAALLVDPGVALAARLRRAAAPFLASVVVLLGWPLVRSALWGPGDGKQVGLHLPTTEKLGGVVDVAGGWFGLPGSWPAALRAALVLVVVTVATTVAVVPRVRRAATGSGFDDARSRGVLLGLAAFVWLFPIVVVLAVSTVDVNVPLDQRVLGPAGVALYVLLAAEGVTVLRARAGAAPSWVPALAVSAVALLLVAVGAPGLARTSSAVRDASAASAADGRRSPVARLERSSLVLTNRPGDLFAQTARAGVLLPAPVRLTDGRTNPRFSAELDQVADLLDRRPGVVVLYRDLAPGGPDVGAALLGAGLVEVTTCVDGVRAFTVPSEVDAVAAAQPC